MWHTLYFTTNYLLGLHTLSWGHNGCNFAIIVIPQGGDLIYLYQEVWGHICKTYPRGRLPESLKSDPYWSNEIRKGPIMEYDSTSCITSVALSCSIKNSVFINSKSLDMFHRTRGFMLLQMTETWV